MNQVIEARAQYATMIGSKTHFELATHMRMMNVQSVKSFIGEIRYLVSTGATRRTEELQKLEKVDMESRGLRDVDDRIYLWDAGFYFHPLDLGKCLMSLCTFRPRVHGSLET
jgi:Zn-dependent oligopeptidase